MTVMWTHVRRNKQDAVVFMNPTLPFHPLKPNTDNNKLNLHVLMKRVLICNFSLGRTFNFFSNVIIASRTWCHSWYWELHNWLPCLGHKSRRQKMKKAPLPHLLVAVRHIFPRCLLKATNSYQQLSTFDIVRSGKIIFGKQRTSSSSSSNIQSVWRLQNL